MQLEIAVMAEAANTTADGRLNVLGIFNQLKSPIVPFVFPQMMLVLKFVASPGEKGTKPGIKIILLDQDGVNLFATTELETHVPLDVPELHPEITVLALLQGITFQKFGPHSFDILVNGSSVKQIPLHVQPALVP